MFKSVSSSLYAVFTELESQQVLEHNNETDLTLLELIKLWNYLRKHGIIIPCQQKLCSFIVHIHLVALYAIWCGR